MSASGFEIHYCLEDIRKFGADNPSARKVNLLPQIDRAQLLRGTIQLVL
jgi:hypothetical protein